jgi:hypothetical protein
MIRSKTLIIILIFFLPTFAKAQFESFKDSVVQLYGVVMTADSLKGLPGVTVMDGEFITIMPFIKKKNLYLIYDVKK